MREERGEKYRSMVREWHWGRSVSKEERERPGCIRGMFHFFDFYQLLFSGGCRTPVTATSPPATDLQYQQQKQNQQIFHTGLEAPRNSLEIEEPEAAIREDYYDVPISIQISHSPATVKKKKEVLMEEDKIRKTQAVTPRTRNIVARLMGIEGLHDEVSSPCLTCYDSTSPVSFSTPIFIANKECSEEKKKKTTKKKDSTSPRRPLRNLNSNSLGSISLPETPRPSSEKHGDTDPRHSLQHNKENSCGYTAQELSFLREVMPKLRKKDNVQGLDENSSLKINFAREAAKQMKSNIHKRDGSLEIIECDEGIAMARKRKQIGKKYVKNNQPQPTCSSPIAGFLESVKSVHHQKSPSSLPSSINLFKPRVNPDAKNVKMGPGKCRKTNNYERFTEKVKRPPSQLTVFSQQTGFLQPATKEQGPLTSHLNVEKEDPKLNYIKAILARADVVGEKNMNWFSPSLPIDPTIFHILELRFPFFEPVSLQTKKTEDPTARLGPLRHRWNRKLIFHLVEEILSGLLFNDPKRWRRKLDSNLLLSRLWTEIKNLPSAKCQIVGDIDALIAGDLAESKVRRILRNPAVVAEVQDIASEIQREMLDSLLGETAETLSHLVLHRIQGRFLTSGSRANGWR